MPQGSLSPPPSPARFGGWRLSSATTELLMCYNISAGGGGRGGRQPRASSLLLGDARHSWQRNLPLRIVLPLENTDSALCQNDVYISTFLWGSWVLTWSI